MECNKTFISIKQLEEQDICAEKICSLLSQLYDELAIFEHALEVNDLNAFRSSMSILLNRVLNLYKKNEDSLSKSGVFQRIKNREQEVEDYQQKVEELKEELVKIEELNKELKDKTKQYDDIKEENTKLEEENKKLLEKVKELEKINLEKLEEENKTLQQNIEKTEEKQKTLTQEYTELKQKYDETEELYNNVLKQKQETQDLIQQITQKTEDLKQHQQQNIDKNKELEELNNIEVELNDIKENNQQLDHKINELKDILGMNYNDDIIHLDRLQSMKNKANEYLKEYLKNNDIEELDEQIELDNMNIVEYLHFIDHYLFTDKKRLMTYYNLTLELRTMISDAISTSREDED